jgi:hypothetical protein
VALTRAIWQLDKMIYPVVQELAAQKPPVALCCRLLGVPTSGY